MITIRFPTGISVAYQEATHVQHYDGAWEIYAGDPNKGGEWICTITGGTGCLIEGVADVQTEHLKNEKQRA